MLDAIASEVIYESLLLSVQLGHKASFWLDMIQQRYKIVHINREVLGKWREKHFAQNGIRDLAQAMNNVGLNITAFFTDV